MLYGRIKVGNSILSSTHVGNNGLAAPISLYGSAKNEAGVGIELDLIFLGKLPNICGSPKTVTPTVTPFSHERR